MKFRINVTVEVEREDGKPATREELAKLIEQAIEDADPGTIETDDEATYEVQEWEAKTWNPN